MPKNKLQHLNLIEEFLFQEIEMYFYSSNKAFEFWNILNKTTESYVFGGFIVDFLNHSNKHRDIDIVVISLNKDTLKLINRYGGIKNSYGGYKITVDHVVIDIWAIKDTWAIKKMNFLDFDLINILPSTSFFNSTAIIYSIQTRKIIYHKKFLDYLNNKKLDILFEDNPYPALCILKSYQYYRLGVSFSNRLSNYINNKFHIYFKQLDKMQMKHYGCLRYSHEELNDFHIDINQYLKSGKRNKVILSSSDQLTIFG